MTSGTKDALLFVASMLAIGTVAAVIIRSAAKNESDADIGDYDVVTYPIEKGWGFTISRDGKLVHKADSAMWDDAGARAAADQYIREMLVGP